MSHAQAAPSRGSRCASGEREREMCFCRFLLGVQGSGLGDVGLGVSVFLGLGFRG